MDETYLKSLKIGFIGGGNMASAIGAGLIRKGNSIVFRNEKKINTHELGKMKL